MGYERVTDRPEVVYHYTQRKNLEPILQAGRIRRFGDTECWFCTSVTDTLSLMRRTVMVEGMPFYAVGGQLKQYPAFVPDDYIILALTPRFQSGEWVRWMQELPPGCPANLVAQAEEFSRLKLGFRGDLKFKGNPEMIEIAPLLEEPVLGQMIQTI